MSWTLLLDIGSGTQDVLLYSPDIELENCPKFVLPSPAKMVVKRLGELKDAGRAVWLHGQNMGGGFGRAVSAHKEAGLAVAAHPDAAYSLGDDLARLEAGGIALTERCPEGHVPVYLSDYDPGFWTALLSMAGLPLPDRVLAAAQDHGFHPGKSNRYGRFDLWKRLLHEADGHPGALLHDVAPPEMTRLTALQSCIGGGPVADTGAAAVLGALFVPEVEAQQRERGITVVNVGNSHTIAFLVYAGRILGVYEHHTGLIAPDKLWAEIAAFRTGRLCFEEVFESRGHGCLTLDLPPEAGDFAPTYALGPRRDMLQDCGCTFLAPGGDMMLAGCFGLLKGLDLRG